nr:uncharacterized protein LOC113815749 [Penaeus vannamei]
MSHSESHNHASAEVAWPSAGDLCQVLDDVMQKMQEFGQDIDTMRVNCAHMAVDLATLHDPQTYEALSRCQAEMALCQKEIIQCQKTMAQCDEDMAPCEEEARKYIAAVQCQQRIERCQKVIAQCQREMARHKNTLSDGTPTGSASQDVSSPQVPLSLSPSVPQPLPSLSPSGSQPLPSLSPSVDENQGNTYRRDVKYQLQSCISLKEP